MSRKNGKVPGLIKDKNNGAIVIEFVGLTIRCTLCASLKRMMLENEKCEAEYDQKNKNGQKTSFDDYARCLRKQVEIVRCQPHTLHVA